MSLESVRKRLEAATPGPWRHAEDYLRAIRTRDGTEVCSVHLSRDRIGWGNRGAVYPDGDLIAHAPTDLALMADVVEAARVMRAVQLSDTDDLFNPEFTEAERVLDNALAAFEEASE